MPSTTWKDLGSPQFLPNTHNMLAFNKGICKPLGILPELPINLEGKVLYIDMMVVQGPLNFKLLLRCDYTYVMGALISSLFRVMCFPHKGRIVIIDQLSFIGPNLTPNQPSSPNNPYIPVVSSLPHVSYVATYSLSLSTNDPFMI